MSKSPSPSSAAEEPVKAAEEAHGPASGEAAAAGSASPESSRMDVDAASTPSEAKQSQSPRNDAEQAGEDDVEVNAEDEEGDGEEKGAGGDAPEEDDPIFDKLLLKPLFERRDKSLKELLESMDEFSPIIPDAVTDYYLAKSGFKTTDHRIKRLLALATQKFVADIASDAYQFSRIRAQSANAGGGAGRGRAGPGSSSGRTVLTMESLNGVLGDYGIDAKRPDFYR